MFVADPWVTRHAPVSLLRGRFAGRGCMLVLLVLAAGPMLKLDADVDADANADAGVEDGRAELVGTEVAIVPDVVPILA